MTRASQRILITGGGGFIGRALIAALAENGYHCIVLSRNPGRLQPHLPSHSHALAYDVPWPPVHAVINLAGETVVGRWTPAKRERIMRSRVETTGRLVAWMETVSPRPELFLSASAVGIYGHRPGERLTETSPLDPQQKFRYQVCRAWEEAARPAVNLGVRVVLLRVGNVLHPAGGYLGTVMSLYHRFPIVGLGDPQIQFSWISLQDTVRLFLFALEQETVAGPLNVTAPYPVSQGAFTRLLAAHLGKPVRAQLPNGLIRLAFGGFADAFLDSQAIYPAGALAQGFTFQDADLWRAFEQ
jgi:uncharacterized protein (TIGR01777 family)